MNKRVVKLAGLLLLCGSMTLPGCGKDSNGGTGDTGGDDGGGGGTPPVEDTVEVVSNTWEGAAVGGQARLDEWWNESRGCFLWSRGGTGQFHYWINAQALDVLVDRFGRQNSLNNRKKIQREYKGISVNNGGTYINTYYDDMAWMALACLRAFDAIGEPDYKATALLLWEEIKGGWNDDNHDGGIVWKKGGQWHAAKNACINNPACIIAARLYRMFGDQDALAWARKLYAWSKGHVVDAATGKVWDAADNRDPGWVFTYNQGTWIGAAVEMFRITGEQTYLDDAVKTANWVVGTAYSPGGNLPGGTDTDGGMFAGICVRYMTNLILLPRLDAGVRQKYVSFLEKNALELRKNSADFYFCGRWTQSAQPDDIGLSSQLSGVMLMEMMYRIGQEYPDLLTK